MSTEWTASEKKIARRVFEAALQRELAELLLAFKAKAANAKGPEDMWSIEKFLFKSRHAIDSKYDYRYSHLHSVFGRLLREGRIFEEDLSGLSNVNLQRIKQLASY